MNTKVHLQQYLAEFLLQYEMFQTKQKFTEIIKALFFNNFIPVYEIMWKKYGTTDRSRMNIRRKDFACWIANATDTRSEYI